MTPLNPGFTIHLFPFASSVLKLSASSALHLGRMIKPIYSGYFPSVEWAPFNPLHRFLCI